MTHNFVEMAARVRLLVDSVAFKSKKLETVSANIRDNRDQSDAFAKDSNHHHSEYLRLSKLSDEHRAAANRQIDEEAEIKVELKAESAELDQIRQAFEAAGIELPAAREMGEVVAGTIASANDTDHELPDLDDAIAEGVDLADDDPDQPTFTEPTYTEEENEMSTDRIGVTPIGGAGAAVLADDARPLGGGNAHPEASKRIEMGDANEPTADEVRDKLDSFVERVRGRGGEVDVSVEEVREVISGVHEVTAEEAIAAGEEDAAEASKDHAEGAAMDIDDDPDVETISGEESVA